MENGKTKFDIWVQSLKIKIKQAPKGFIKLKCKTIINALGVKNKTKKVDDLIAETLHGYGIETLPDFHACDGKEYITLSLKETTVEPTDIELTDHEKHVLEQLAKKDLDSEMSVSIRFIVPLLELLGYSEEDRSDSYTIEIFEGSTTKRKKADFVLFNGRNRANNNSLLLVEAKAVGVDLKKSSAIGQARSYTMWIGSPYYIVTNGEEIRIFRLRNAYQADQEVFYGKRNELNEDLFNAIYSHISKNAIIKLKAQTQQ